METDRRSFLKGLLTVAAVAVMPKPALADYPVLHGDGIHDDTAALQTMVNGGKIIIEGSVVDTTISPALCHDMRFLLSDTLTFNGTEQTGRVQFYRCVFEKRGGTGPVIFMKSGSGPLFLHRPQFKVDAERNRP